MASLTKKAPFVFFSVSFANAADVPLGGRLPLEQASENSPRLISNDVTYEAIREEFGVAFSEDSFKNWIKGNRGNKYEEDELQPFWEIFDDQIMHKNVNSGL